MVSLADFLVRQSRSGSSSKLDKISSLIHWEKYRYRLKKILSRSGDGPPSYDEVSMFRILILQRIYNLSDTQMEEMLYDRLSFRRFCGFGLADNLPDETTICRFRQLLSGKSELLLQLINKDLSAQGICMQGGKIIDATIIDYSGKRPSGGEQSESDPAAGWTKKRGGYHYGYKSHISTYAESYLISSTKATSANVHDGQVFASLLEGDETIVYADKAYDSKHNRHVLSERQTESGILYKARRHKPLLHWQVQANKLYSKTRHHVERVFAHLKCHYGYRRYRYKGWAANQVHLDLLAIAYNLKRALTIL